MAPKKITGYVKLQIMAGKATPAPPVGPALGQAQVNIMEFCKQFNDRTKGPDLAGLTIPVVAAIDARHDHVYMQVFGSGGRTLLAPRIAPLREAGLAATTGPARVVGSAAHLVARSWPR